MIGSRIFLLGCIVAALALFNLIGAGVLVWRARRRFSNDEKEILARSAQIAARESERRARRAEPITRREWAFFWLLVLVGSFAILFTQGCHSPTAPIHREPQAIIEYRTPRIDTLVAPEPTPESAVLWRRR